MRYVLPIILLLCGAIFLILSLVIPSIFPTLYQSQLEAKLVLAPDAEIMKTFTQSTASYQREVWFFNITNVEGILQGEKPVLKEIGPYVYREVRKKANFRFNDSKGTVTYNTQKFFFFDPILSVGLETDLITTVNPIFLTMASKVDNYDGFKAIRGLAQLFLMRFNYKPFMKQSVAELLFKGFEDDLIKELYILTQDEKYKDGRFGFMLNNNGSFSKNLEVFTGALGMSNYQIVASYNGMETLPYWRTKYCNTLSNSTSGGQFTPPVTRNQSIIFFVAELCRSIYGVYETDTSIGPLRLYRFVLPEELFTLSLDNFCYCTDIFTCRATMVDVSPCRDGSPVVVSVPHFYQGLEVDIHMVEGLNPKKKEHETYLDVEPTTGIVFRAAKRIQINMVFKKFDQPILQNIQEVIMPIFWITDRGTAQTSSAETLYSALTNPQEIVHIGSWVVFGISLAIIFLGLLIFCCRYKNQYTEVNH